DVGELGTGTTNNIPNPVPGQVPGLSNVVKLSARDYHNIAVKSDGSVWMWGANDHGQCGINTTNDVWTPVQVLGLGPRVALPLIGHFLPCSLENRYKRKSTKGVNLSCLVNLNSQITSSRPRNFW